MIDELDMTDPLRASIYSLAYLLYEGKGDLPKDIIDLIETIIEQERN
tara:strand:+ start:652 stop:792 length:141 start_codon:yes stop_codon:yes gene_type:complete